MSNTDESKQSGDSLREIVAMALAKARGCNPDAEPFPCLTLANAVLAAIEASGRVVAPVEPDSAMCMAPIIGGWNVTEADAFHIYEAMLAARPRDTEEG